MISKDKRKQTCHKVDSKRPKPCDGNLRSWERKENQENQEDPRFRSSNVEKSLWIPRTRKHLTHLGIHGLKDNIKLLSMLRC